MAKTPSKKSAKAPKKAGGKGAARASTRLMPKARAFNRSGLSAGIDLGPPRLPLQDITEEQFEELRAGLVAGGFIAG